MKSGDTGLCLAVKLTGLYRQFELTPHLNFKRVHQPESEAEAGSCLRPVLLGGKCLPFFRYAALTGCVLVQIVQPAIYFLSRFLLSRKKVKAVRLAALPARAKAAVARTVSGRARLGREHKSFV